MVSEAVGLFERGKEDEALSKLKEVLAADPSAEDAFRLINKIEFRKWARMLAREGEIAAVIMELMHTARPAERAKVADKEAIRALIEQLDSDQWGERLAAFRKLAADHGEYAAPYLIKRLGSEDPERRAAAMSWLRKLGVQAVLPLIQALEIENERVQAGAVIVLGQIGDPRAAPYVLLTAGRSGIVGEAAMKAAREMGVDGAPLPRMLALAEAYYQRDRSVVDPFRGIYPVWRCVDGERLVSHEVPRDVYPLKLAEEVLYDVLAAQPENADARVLLVSVLLAEAAGVKAGSGDDGGSATSALANARVMAGVAGTEVLDAVLKKALNDGRPDVAAGAARLLGGMLSSETFMAPCGLTDALTAPNKAVRFEAALAVAGLSPAHPFDGSERVVANLAEALNEAIVRSVLVVDDREASRMAISEALDAAGFTVNSVAYGSYGLARLREAPVEDVLILRYDLSDQSVNEVIKLVRKDEKTANVPILLLCEKTQMEKAGELYEDKVQGFLEVGASAEAVVKAVREAMPELDEARQRADAVAAAAASALAAMPARDAVLSSSGARGALEGVLKRSDQVRLPALRALRVIADPASIPALLATFQDEGASEDIRGAAALALGAASRSAGQVSGEVADVLKAAVAGEGGYAYMLDLGRAIGIAPFSTAERTALLKALRERIKVDEME